MFQLLPLSFREAGRLDMLLGGFPEVRLRPRLANDWFRSYVQTYIERDVRSLLSVRDLATFRRFLALLASRHGQILNRTDLAAPLGVSVPTIGAWLDVLETTGHVILVPPYYENFGKRLIKSPKVYWVDSGLVCHLLGLTTRAGLERSPFVGPVFEGLVASELVKSQVHAGRRREIYYFRDQQGLEVDCVVPGGSGSLHLVEAKWTRTVAPGVAGPLVRLMTAGGGRFSQGWIVTRGPAGGPHVVAPGVRTTRLEDFLAANAAR